MPKLLRKSILKSSVVAFIIVCLLVLFGCVGRAVDASVSICGIYTAFNMILFFADNPSLKFGICGVELPDYVFVAPYSRNERVQAIRKLFRGKLISAYSIFFCFLILPVMIWSIINGRAGNVALCIMESIVCVSLCYSGMYYTYLARTGKGTEAYIAVVRFLEMTLYAGFTDMSRRQSFNELINKMDAVEAIVIAVIMMLAVSSIIVCKKKYWETMTTNLADYEYSKELGKRGK